MNHNILPCNFTIRAIRVIIRLSRSTCLLLVALLLVVGCIHQTPPLPTTPIVYVSDRDGAEDIYVMHMDGAGPRRLTSDPGEDDDPDWSPDGRHIAFVSERDNDEDFFNTEIYVMNADGSEQKRLTKNRATDSSPKWSPDGSRIAFESGGEAHAGIYVIQSDGSRMTQLIEYGTTPAWSPDGQWIVFSALQHGDVDIFKVRVDGSDLVQLTTTVGEDSGPVWSPDGQHIAFFSTRDKVRCNESDACTGEIYIMDADGTHQTRLTHNKDDDRWPQWSPDSHFLIFDSTRNDAGVPEILWYESNTDIYIMRADGSDERRLTTDEAYEGQPSWAPQ